MMDMVQSLAVSVKIPYGEVNMKVSVHEDNSGAFVLAETLTPQFTPPKSIMQPRLFSFGRKFISGVSNF